jgi:hypothetical protein
MRKYLVLMSFVCTLAQAQTGATVSGGVQGPDGKPIASAFVVLAAQPPKDNVAFRPYYAATESNAAGVYKFDNVPEGQFRICVQAIGTNLLNPCEWGVQVAGGLTSEMTEVVQGLNSGAPMIAVKGAGNVNAGMTKLIEGYLLRVQVNDVQNLVKDNMKRLSDAHLSFEVAGVGRTQLLRPLPGNKAINEYGVVVPYDVDLDLTTHFNRFNIVDEDNASAKADKRLSRRIRIAKGTEAPTIKIKVNGVEAQ